jgi:K+-sensing histidine kinase KdpD
MFEFQGNDTSAVENSQLNIRDKGKDMNSSENIMTNSPTILRSMSHEMRTHMNAIVAFSYLMKKNICNNSEREEFSNQILSSSEQLIGLFDNFFDSAIIDAGNSKAESKICKFNNILDDLFSEFREVIKKEGNKEVELVTEIQFNNSVEVFIDKNKIFRVIRSLFQNSLKNTKTGYIKIGYYFRDNSVIFYVLDSGQSYFKCKEFIHSENMNESLSLFNDVYTAINITLAKKLIQMLEGTIWIECNGLTGAGIYFSVPSKMIANSNINYKKYINTMIAI